MSRELDERTRAKADGRTVRRLLAPFVILALAAAAIAGCGSAGSSPSAGSNGPDGSIAAGSAVATSPAGSLTQVFPDGTRVSLVSAEWTALSQYNQAPYGVKFIFRIVAGPRWSSSAKVSLCINCGDRRPLGDYMVTIPGWSYPKTNSTGYSDLVGDITTAQGGSLSVGPDAGAGLTAGDSASASSTLIPPSGSPGGQQVTVSIEMPDTTLASETFLVNIDPNPDGGQP
jgi:hypothetical protein